MTLAQAVSNSVCCSFEGSTAGDAAPPRSHPAPPSTHHPRLSVWQPAIRTSPVNTPDPHYQLIKSNLSGIICLNLGGIPPGTLPKPQQWEQAETQLLFWNVTFSFSIACLTCEQSSVVDGSNFCSLCLQIVLSSQYDQTANKARDIFHKHNVQLLFQRTVCSCWSLYTFYLNNRKKVKICHNLNIHFRKITSFSLFSNR